MISYNEFKIQLLDRLREQYPNAVLCEREILKVNKKWNAIILEEEGRNYPTIYPENLYENYKEVEDMEIILAFVECAAKPEVYIKACMERLKCWSEIKESLFPYVANREKNEEYFETGKTYEPYLDLAIGLYVDLGTDEEGGNATVFVTDALLKYWKITKEQAYETAYSNAKYRVQTLQDVLEELMGKPLSDEGEEIVTSKKSWMLSTLERRYGAAGIVDVELLRKTAERLDSDFYILPCSIHELILVPEETIYSKQSIYEAIRNINEKEVDDEVFLSNNVYFYSREECQVKIVEVD